MYETIEKGAYMKLTVKYGLVRLVNIVTDLCDQVKNVDLECPINKGVLSITKEVELPREIPPVHETARRVTDGVDTNKCSQGRYNVFADVYTKEDKPITCLTAQVVFGGQRSGAGFFEL